MKPGPIQVERDKRHRRQHLVRCAPDEHAHTTIDNGSTGWRRFSCLQLDSQSPKDHRLQLSPTVHNRSLLTPSIGSCNRPSCSRGECGRTSVTRIEKGLNLVVKSASSPQATTMTSTSGGFLEGIRVLEVADEMGEYCGKLLAGLGADVIKVEPPQGEVTRTYGPFYGDVPETNRSLYFWHYNFGKRGITLDLDSTSGQSDFHELSRTSDVVIDTRVGHYMPERGLGYASLRQFNPGIIYARITPFGEDGPWTNYSGSDLIHLALGGIVMNCGYDPEPDGTYDICPIAPQMWQAYQIAGEIAAIGVISALVYRLRSGRGQRVSIAVHQAVNTTTDIDLPNWVYRRQRHYRRTCRNSQPQDTGSTLSATKDGRWVLPYRTYVPGPMDVWANTVGVLDAYGMAGDLVDEKYRDPSKRSPEVGLRLEAQIDRLVGRLKFSRAVWHEAWTRGLPWAPLRRPEENVDDEHWLKRETFFRVFHSELGLDFDYVGAKWFSPQVAWRRAPRAPLLAEHNAEILGGLKRGRPAHANTEADLVKERVEPRNSPDGQPFALDNVRIVDLSWILASGGAGRFFSAMGAEVIKVEHQSRWDGLRWGPALAPLGGRSARNQANGPIVDPNGQPSPNRGGFFMEINSGKFAISLNLKSERGRELLLKLIAGADMVIEGFSPGTMGRMGLGYASLKSVNPRIIYVQQSGMGQVGTYGAVRSFGPTAQAVSGLTEMSGLPEPYPPAGIGYSYLDSFGAYNMAAAMMAALFRQRVTGRGCYIDSSQAETGIYLTGTAVLDYSANGRRWRRYGNRSPYKLAAPHGIYRVAGDDRWIAIACFTDDQWSSLLRVLGDQSLSRDPKFATLGSRVRNQDALDGEISELTTPWEPVNLMVALQAAGVPAGVCQDAEDRYEMDPQLRHLRWLRELRQSEIGAWPVKEIPIGFSETPTYIGGLLDRSGPNYGEDNEYVFGTILGLSTSEIEELVGEGII